MSKQICYKYRCTSGKQIDATKAYSGDINKAIAKLKDEYRCSITPIVEIEGKPVDIREYLNESLAAAENRVNYWREIIDALTHEIDQYNKIFNKE